MQAGRRARRPCAVEAEGEERKEGRKEGRGFLEGDTGGGVEIKAGVKASVSRGIQEQDFESKDNIQVLDDPLEVWCINLDKLRVNLSNYRSRSLCIVVQKRELTAAGEIATEQGVW